MRVVVTGGAGFIGSHVAVSLVERGYDVIVVDNLFRASKFGVRMLKEHGVPLVSVDVREWVRVAERVGRFDAVVHAAALINAAESVEKPVEYCSVNVDGTVAMLKLSVRVGAERFVFISSAAVYGEPLYLPIDEMHPTRPLNPYGASKLAGEVFVETFWRVYRLPYVILRLFNVYGPGQSGAYAGLIAKTIERVSRGEPPVVYGDGLQTRDFVFVADVAEAVRLSLETGNVNEVYNIGSGREHRVIDVVETILKLMGKKHLKPVFAPPRPGDVRRSVANIQKARTLLRFNPRYSLEEGLHKTIRAYVDATISRQ